MVPQVQRPWGRSKLGMLEEQQGDKCGWSRLKEGQNNRREVGDKGGFKWGSRKNTGPFQRAISTGNNQINKVIDSTIKKISWVK